MNSNSYDPNQAFGAAGTQRQQPPQQQQSPGYYSNYNPSYGSPQLYTNKQQTTPSSSAGSQQQQANRYDQPPQSQSSQQQQQHQHQQQSASSNHNTGSPRQHQPRPNANYESQWQLYSADWAHSSPKGLDLLAVSTYTEESSNKIQIVQGFTPATVGSNGNGGDGSGTPGPQQPSLEFQKVAEYSVPYPCTKIAWAPPSLRGNPGSNANTSGANMQLITTGDCLRLWSYNSDSAQLQQRCALINKTKSSYMPPVTSFDWNRADPSIVITSSIDTTCTVWDIAASTAHTQLIAHDSEVFDVSFVANSTHIFASVGADGSVRVFDLRSLDHSTIIYEPQQPVPLVRIVGNPLEENILATLAANTNEIYILDVRVPGVPVATLTGHKAPVNSIAWAPAAAATAGAATGGSARSYRHILASGADDCQALIWDVSEPSINPKVHPHGTDVPVVSAYTDSQEINYVTWNSDASWLGVVRGRGVQAVKL
ncbi:hypothetical protein DV113_003505 [Geotrichum candidum]|uniref:Uncharacterized protein n=1 Tax=Geotrichum candidum TaxID=1173061 RepID=A0A0J9XF11_GEOCN|nr:hypothetical protein DV113_003505 [Geotrichum candidum]CDO55834.1 similar to Saccharomyces cerevisiae YPL247C Putative protein of unknown function [Geotrichum candidum]